MKKLFFLSLALSALVGCANDASDPTDAADDSADDGATASLAADRGITLAEAAQRMAWQDKLDDLEAALQSELPASYGGVWIDPDNGDRVQIAVTADASDTDVMAIAQQLGVDAGTDVIRVKHSQAELHQIADVLGDDAGIDPIANVVTVPTATAITAQYGDAVQVQAAIAASPQATSFDPPMRGGVKMTSNGIVCTAGFLAHTNDSDHKPVILTAGHCVTAANRSGVWTGYFANGSAHGLTAGGNYKVNAGGDMSALTMVNVPKWKPQPWIVVQKGGSTDFHPKYGIVGTAASHVGTRVCETGVSSGTHCGTIQKLDVPIVYPNDPTQIAHQVQTSICAEEGDSGGPVFASHKAFGTHTAASSACVTYFEPINQIETQMNVTVAHCVAKNGTASAPSECCSLEATASHSPDFVTCQ